jgi:maleate isomerase
MIPFETDGGAGSRARLGLVVLQSDETIEPELARISSGLPGVALHHCRIPSTPNVTTASLRQMHARLPAAVSLFPDGGSFDVIGYGCTSGSTVIGERNVEKAIQSVYPTAKVTNPLTALKAACQAMNIQRLGIITPYERAVTDALGEHLTNNGLQITSVQSFEQINEAVVARIKPASILDALTTLKSSKDNANCDAWFVSCTNLRMAEITNPAEER